MNNYDVIKLTADDLDYIYSVIHGHQNPDDVLRQIPLPRISLHISFCDKNGTPRIHKEDFTFDEEHSLLTVEDYDCYTANKSYGTVAFQVSVRQNEDGRVGFSEPHIMPSSPSWARAYLFKSVDFYDHMNSKTTAGFVYSGYVARYFNVNTFVREMTPEVVFNSEERQAPQPAKSSASKKKKHKPGKVKLYKVYRFKENWKDVVAEHRHNTITCPAWGVKGHYRHYKDGKVVWVKAYIKGKDKDKYQEKEYELIPSVI